MSLELRREDGAGDITLVVSCLEMVFKAKDDII